MAQPQPLARRSHRWGVWLLRLVLRDSPCPGGGVRGRGGSEGPKRALAAPGPRPPSRTPRPPGAARTPLGQKKGRSRRLQPPGRPLAASPIGIAPAPSTMLLRRRTGPCSTASSGRSGGVWARLWGTGWGGDSCPQVQLTLLLELRPPAASALDSGAWAVGQGFWSLGKGRSWATWVVGGPPT